MCTSTERIQKIKAQIEQGKSIKDKAEGTLGALRNSFSACDEKLKALGIKDTKQAEKEVLAMENELQLKLKQLEDSIPVDIIEKYKNYDFNSEIPNENLDF